MSVIAPKTRISIAILVAFLSTQRAEAQCEQSTVAASDAVVGDDFGGAVAIDGDVMVVGAPERDDAGGSSGAAYVFRFDGASWNQEQRLNASDADSFDDYGIAVAVRGDTIAVGSNRDDLPGLSNAGSVYVYRFNEATLQWEEEDHLTAMPPVAGDRFGSSVAISGETLLVGATHHDTDIANAGAGYVFIRDGVTWSQQALLTADMPTGSNPNLGRSASIEGDVAVLGAWQDAPAGMFTVGAAYVFRREGTTWTQEQKLTASDAADFSQFGQAVSLSGDVIAVGAPREHLEGPSDSGAAYFYRWDGKNWDEEAKVKASDAENSDRFGWSIAVEGSSVVIGTDASASKTYLFEFSGEGWEEQAMLNSIEPEVSGEYGYSVALSGGIAAIGDRNGAAGTGLAFVFETEGPDCNDTNLCDSRDIEEGASDDDNGNGIPDECENDCPADFNGDGVVGPFDLAQLLAAWGPNAGNPADLNGDGVVGPFDLATLLAAWGPCE